MIKAKEEEPAMLKKSTALPYETSESSSSDDDHDSDDNDSRRRGRFLPVHLVIVIYFISSLKHIHVCLTDCFGRFHLHDVMVLAFCFDSE